MEKSSLSPRSIFTCIFLFFIAANLCAQSFDLQPIALGHDIEWNEEHSALLIKSLEDTGFFLNEGSSDKLSLSLKRRGKVYLLSLQYSISDQVFFDYSSCKPTAEALKRTIEQGLVRRD